MKYSLDILTRDVMARLGEFPRPRPSLPGVSSPDSIPWSQDIIALKVRSLLPEVGSRLILEAPSPPEGGEAIESPASGGPGIWMGRCMPCGLYAAEIPLPDDFLRLESVKMGEWRHAVSQVIVAADSGWLRQWSPEVGIAGCPERPRAYLDRTASGPLLRLVGSHSVDDSLGWLRLWRVPIPDEDGCFDFPATLWGQLTSAIVSLLDSVAS